ncbi:flagellar basal body-associated FliL family protein [Yoonia litorea]|uniref:Flagellar protein FliL n=1 Tax=Yoonia litorea TaxID=1123755 RepID=A0A1I6MU43_9RHOB|nr:flagellar basal body-associated FliL family protein [Yoonia litorea]SFS19232.1 hypothetical protein SAMN05444714_2130 [Yoonia litorea]
MKAVILPIVLFILGSSAGAGAGYFLNVTPSEMDDQGCVVPEDHADSTTELPPISEEREYAKLNNQFVIPVVEDGAVAALVVLSLNLEVTVGNRPAIFAAEPKLRDRFLQVMFDHANTGGFSGNFTSGLNMQALRRDLLRVAQDVSGDAITDVLIIDIVRQDT